MYRESGYEGPEVVHDLSGQLEVVGEDRPDHHRPVGSGEGGGHLGRQVEAVGGDQLARVGAEHSCNRRVRNEVQGVGGMSPGRRT